MKAVLLIASLLAPVSGAGGGSDWYVVDASPASVVRVDSQSMRAGARCDLNQRPSLALRSPNGKLLFVLLNGAFDVTGQPVEDRSSLAVIDTASMSIVQTIPLGWRVYRVSFSRDARFLMCLSSAKSQDKHSNEEPPVITVIDVVTAKTVTRRIGTSSDIKFSTNEKNPMPQQDVLFTDDLSRLFLYDSGVRSRALRLWLRKPVVPASVTMFALNNESFRQTVHFGFAGNDQFHPDINFRPYATLSPDGKWLYVVDCGFYSETVSGKMWRPGKVYVIEANSGALAGEHEIGMRPLKPVADADSGAVYIATSGSTRRYPGKLYKFVDGRAPAVFDTGFLPQFLTRIDGLPGLAVVCDDEIRVFQDRPSAAPLTIVLGRAKGRSGESAGGVKLGGSPGAEILRLPKLNRLAIGIDRWDYVQESSVPSDKVAIVDTEANRLHSVVTIGRGGVKFAKELRNVSISVAVSMAAGYASYSAASAGGATSAPIPIFGIRAQRYAAARLAISSDQTRLFAFNRFTNDVTVIDPGEGAILGYIPVGGGFDRIVAGADGLSLWLSGPDHVKLMDMKSSEILAEYKSETGKILDFGIMEDGGAMALTESAIVILDNRGTPKTVVPGFSKPHLMIK